MISCRGVAKKRRRQARAVKTVKCPETVACRQQSWRPGNARAYKPSRVARPTILHLKDVTPRSRGTRRPRFDRTFALQGNRGHREDRMHAGTRGLVRKIVRRSAHEHTGSAEAIRPSLRNGLTAYAVLSSATNSSCHRRCRLDGRSIRLDRNNHRQLDTSNGCRDHTVLPYASASLVLRAGLAHELPKEPPCSTPARANHRVHRIPPRVS
jgi:hypothetical protein